MFQNIKEFFKRLFGIKPRTTDEQQNTNSGYDDAYEDIRNVNITAWVANKIANIVVSDSDISVAGNNPRAEFLGESLATCTDKLKNIVTRSLAVGGVVLKPYVHNGRLYTDILPQSRFLNVMQSGENITAACFEAEVLVKDDVTYTRMEYHKLENGTYTIEQKALENMTSEITLASVPEWEKINPSITIRGVEQMLFGLVRCPVDNRGTFNDVYGVPVTFGQERTIREIIELLEMFQKECKNKEAFVGVSELLFDGNDKLPADGIYVGLNTESNDFFEVFSPDIRTQAYIDTINYKLELLEKAIGVNKGVLTNLDTADATATAIKRSTFDTWTLVDDTRTAVEAGINALVYAFDVFANSGLAPHGRYEVKYDWDFSLLEDTAERFNQLRLGLADGVIHGYEARAWITGETEEVAKKNMPDLDDMLED